MIRLGTRTKAGKGREVPLLDRSAELLAAMPRHLHSPYVLLKEDGTRLVSVQKGFKAACRRAKLEGLIWHDLRRTAGCRFLIDHGLSMEDVKEILGHSSVAVTEKSYAFLDIEAIKARLRAAQKRTQAQRIKEAKVLQFKKLDERPDGL